MTQTVRKGDTILLHYTGMYEDGKVFDSTLNKTPIPVEVGDGQMIRGLEKTVLGMQPGEEKTVTVEPEEAYGRYDENLLVEKPKEMIAENLFPKVGMKLMLVSQEGENVPAVVTEIKDESIKLDANHPLAGKTLVFDIKLVEIV